MEFRGSSVPQSEEEIDLKRGPWTVEEDLILMNYIAVNGEGKWNSLARCAGLRRTGKSCRLRWLNYLRPDVRRGNITPEEQFLILELHSRWGNRWSKIAQYLPGRTDNEIKNYWRTRVQKHAKQLKCDVNSKQFKDVMRYLWMPRLLERIRAASGDSFAGAAAPMSCGGAAAAAAAAEEDEEEDLARLAKMMSPENSSAAGTSASVSASVSASLESSIGIQFSPPAVSVGECSGGGGDVTQLGGDFWSEEPLAWLPSPDGAGQADLALPELDQAAWGESLWSVEDIWLQQQF